MDFSLLEIDSVGASCGSLQCGAVVLVASATRLSRAARNGYVLRKSYKVQGLSRNQSRPPLVTCRHQVNTAVATTWRLQACQNPNHTAKRGKKLQVRTNSYNNALALVLIGLDAQRHRRQ